MNKRLLKMVAKALMNKGIDRSGACGLTEKENEYINKLIRKWKK